MVVNVKERDELLKRLDVLEAITNASSRALKDPTLSNRSVIEDHHGIKMAQRRRVIAELRRVQGTYNPIRTIIS